MFWPRRRYTPWWMRLLAMIGFRYLLHRIAGEIRLPEADWRTKGRRFRRKLREAFQVWEEPGADNTDDTAAPNTEDA